MASDPEKVLQLFLAGATYSQIASAVEMPENKVHDTVVAALAESADRRNALTENAVAVHRERTEALFRAHWGPALRGDIRSADLCNRILERQFKFMDSPSVVEVDSIDEIAARRAARRSSTASRAARANRS
jgi:hypothetical protein